MLQSLTALWSSCKEYVGGLPHQTRGLESMEAAKVFFCKELVGNSVTAEMRNVEKAVT